MSKKPKFSEPLLTIGTKVGEAKITKIEVKGTVSASGCAIPSDGQVTITLDTGFSNMTYGKLVAK